MENKTAFTNEDLKKFREMKRQAIARGKVKLNREQRRRLQALNKTRG